MKCLKLKKRMRSLSTQIIPPLAPFLWPHLMNGICSDPGSDIRPGKGSTTEQMTGYPLKPAIKKVIDPKE